MAADKKAIISNTALVIVDLKNITSDRNVFEFVYATLLSMILRCRLVYDRETGKPKGYGFCEYQDVETAQSAMRNLNNHDFNGRPLRVGVAAGEQKDDNKSMSWLPHCHLTPIYSINISAVSQ